MSNELVKNDHYMTELDYARKVGEMIVKSGKWSKDWNLDTVAVLVLYARDLGIHPVKALMNGFDIIQGKISMKPILMNDMIRRAGHSIKFIQNTDKACVLRGTRRDTGDTCEVAFTIDDAKRAKLSGKDNYQSWTSDMLYSRAMGRLARMLFPDVIGGAYSDGEMEDIKFKTKQKQEAIDQKELDAIFTESAEVTEVKEEKPVENILTAIDLQQGLMSMGKEYDLLTLSKFVAYMSEMYKKQEDVIIRSALSSEDQLGRFEGHLMNWAESMKEEPVQA